MAAICTSSTSPGNCSHRIMTVTVDGTPVVIHTSEGEAVVALTAEELQTLARLTVRRLRGQGVTLANMLNRVCVGDEATNVKLYQFFGPGAAITKTNIGTAYVNIPPGLNGERILVDLTGCTQYRVRALANLVGTGQWGMRVVRDGDNVVLYENTNIGASGEREIDTGWQSLPAAFLGQVDTLMRAQGKSTTAADDPIFRSLSLGVR